MENEVIKQGEKKLFKDFTDRWQIYSGLGWKNRKGMNKSSIGGQVPAFAIRLVSDKTLSGIKKFPEIYDEIRKMSIIFQYIKYKPKEAARLWAAKTLNEAKWNATNINYQRQRQGLKRFKMPTRETLGINYKMEEFKKNYKKILIRKNDGTLDFIKSDWTGYLIGLENKGFEDKQVIGQDYFFVRPAIIRATNKTEIEEKIFKKIKKILDRIETIINVFKYGSPDIYKSYKSEIIRLAKSLTIEGLNEELKIKENRLQEMEIGKKILFDGNKKLEKELELDSFDEKYIPVQQKTKIEKKNPDLEWQEI